MKTKILTKIAIASMLCAPSCAVERGVIIDRQELPEENALFVNLIQKDKSKQKPLVIPDDGMYDADRKLFFMDSTYTEPFVYSLPGDTISFYNAGREQFIDMGRGKNHVRDINGIREHRIIKLVRSRQK